MIFMYSIGQVSKYSGVKIPTIRYYEEIGLITPSSRSHGNQRRYSKADLERLTFIKHARQLGFTLNTVRDMIDLSATPTEDCQQIDKLARTQLSQVQVKIAQLRRMETELERMVTGCENGNIEQCYVVESLINHELCLEEHG